MKRYWEQLKPQERRWAVGIGVVVFLMLNYFFIWPHRHDWGRDSARMQTALASNQVYQAEIAHKAEYIRKIADLESDGSQVLPEDQAIDFIHFYSSREVSNKITPINNGPLVTRTNEFFVEQQMGISVQSDETNLVNFLYSLSAGTSMMRVRAMSLHPDPSHMQLTAALTLVASYQKKATGRATAGPGPTPTRPASAVTAPPAVAPPVTPQPRPANRFVKVPEPQPAPLPFQRPPGNQPSFFPRPGANPGDPAAYPGNQPYPANTANPTNPFGRTNRIAGAFGRPNAPARNLKTTDQ